VCVCVRVRVCVRFHAAVQRPKAVCGAGGDTQPEETFKIQPRRAHPGGGRVHHLPPELLSHVPHVGAGDAALSCTGRRILAPVPLPPARRVPVCDDVTGRVVVPRNVLTPLPVMYVAHGLSSPPHGSRERSGRGCVSSSNGGLLECQQRACALAPASREKAGRLRSRDLKKIQNTKYKHTIESQRSRELM